MHLTAASRCLPVDVGISWFWVVGATLLTQFPNLAIHFHANNEVVTLFLATSTVGIAAGTTLQSPATRKITAKYYACACGVSLFLLDLDGRRPEDCTRQAPS